MAMLMFPQRDAREKGSDIELPMLAMMNSQWLSWLDYFFQEYNYFKLTWFFKGAIIEIHHF